MTSAFLPPRFPLLQNTAAVNLHVMTGSVQSNGRSREMFSHTPQAHRAGVELAIGRRYAMSGVGTAWELLK
jgi:hypothetical protein